MYFYLYKTVNRLNGHFYIGVHKTNNLDDGYMGSGVVIKNAINKHGKDNFYTQILELFGDAESMYQREAEIVTEEFLARDDVYNLRRGGRGGFDHISFTPEIISRRNEAIKIAKIKQAQEMRDMGIPSNMTDEIQAKALSVIAENRDAVARKRKITYAEKCHQQGSKNSQFGTCWIYHELVGNKKCKLILLPEYLEQGWVKGRFKT